MLFRSVEMAEMAQGITNLRREMKNLQITLLMQDNKLGEIQQQLKKLVPVTKDEDLPPEIMVD